MIKTINWRTSDHQRKEATVAADHSLDKAIKEVVPPWLGSYEITLLLLGQQESHLGIQPYNITKVTIEFDDELTDPT